MAVAMAPLILPNDDMEISSDVEGGNFIDIEVDDEIAEDEDYMIDDHAVIGEGSGLGFQTQKLKDDDIMVDDGEAQNGESNGTIIDNDVVLLDEEAQEDDDIPEDDLEPSDIQGVITPKPDYAAQEALLRSVPDTCRNHDNDLSTLPSAASSPGVTTEDHIEFPEHSLEAARFPQPNAAEDDNASKEADTADTDAEEFVPVENGYDIDEHSVVPGRLLPNHTAIQNEHKIGLGIHADNYQLEEGSDRNSLLDRVHPILVRYEREEIFLFRTQDVEDPRSFFFDDESLVFESVKDVLRKCKELLADSLDEHTILEFRIPVLELIIAEVSFSILYFRNPALTCIGLSRSRCINLTRHTNSIPPLE